MFALDSLLQIMLGSFRMGGMLIAMPLFGRATIPPQLRMFFAIGIGIAMLPFQKSVPPEVLSDTGLLILIIGKELGLGLVMGFSIRLIIVLVALALEFAGLQMGLGIASLLDPQTNQNISVIGSLGIVLAMLIIFTTELHHYMFATLVHSFTVIPIGVPEWKMGTIITNLIGFMGNVFESALQLAFPIAITMLILHFIVGVITRTAPQMNLFFNVSLIVNVVTGTILVMLILPKMYPEIVLFTNRMAKTGFGLW